MLSYWCFCFSPRGSINASEVPDEFFCMKKPIIIFLHQHYAGILGISVIYSFFNLVIEDFASAYFISQGSELGTDPRAGASFFMLNLAKIKVFYHVKSLDICPFTCNFMATLLKLFSAK